MATLRYFIRPLLTATLAASATLPAFAFEDDRLTIWMGDNKGQQGIQLLAEQFLEETGIEVEVVFPDNLTDRFQQAAGSGQGPDIVIWAHDRIGEWAQSGLLKQIAPSDSFRESFMTSLGKLPCGMAKPTATPFQWNHSVSFITKPWWTPRRRALPS